MKNVPDLLKQRDEMQMELISLKTRLATVDKALSKKRETILKELAGYVPINYVCEDQELKPMKVDDLDLDYEEGYVVKVSDLIDSIITYGNLSIKDL